MWLPILLLALTGAGGCLSADDLGVPVDANTSPTAASPTQESSASPTPVAPSLPASPTPTPAPETPPPTEMATSPSEVTPSPTPRPDTNTPLPTTPTCDGDGDGYGCGELDCDDNDAEIYPGAQDVCGDNLDGDCDGLISDGLMWYLDADNDGAGGTTSLDVCVPPASYVATSDDCDDTDPAINPGAEESCDGIDNNCDQVIDDRDTFYLDGDGDGHGDGTQTVPGCETPTIGQAATGDDCDDTRADVYPGADELCDNLDNNCNEVIDDRDTFYTDNDADGYGDAESPVIGCETPPPGTSTNSDDCNDAAVNTHPGASELCGDGDNDCDPTTGCFSTDSGTTSYTSDVLFYGLTGGDQAGTTVILGDFDGTGTLDVAFGAPRMDLAPPVSQVPVLDAGAVLVYFDPFGTSTGGPAVLYGALAGDLAGSVLANAGDINGDGRDDLLIGAPTADLLSPPTLDVGKAYLVLGRAREDWPTDGGLLQDEADMVVPGTAPGDQVGMAMAGVGDVNGDGKDDFVIGAPGIDTSSSTNVGNAGLFLDGDVGGSPRELDEASLVFKGDQDNANLGTGILSLGDVTGDGLSDLLIGAKGKRSSDGRSLVGNIMLYESELLAAHNDGDSIFIGNANARIYGAAEGSCIGTTMSRGDLDGDGRLELWITDACLRSSGVAIGAIYSVEDFNFSTRTLGAGDQRLTGTTNMTLGASLHTDFDINSDGHTDVLVGASPTSLSTSSTSGLFMFTGTMALNATPVTSAPFIISDSPSLGVGFSSVVGDVNGDGFLDIVFGAPLADLNGRQDSGAVYYYEGHQ